MVVQLRVAVLSGRVKVRGCGGVTLCGREAASADMAVFVWGWGEVIETGEQKQYGQEKEVGGMFSFSSYFS